MTVGTQFSFSFLRAQRRSNTSSSHTLFSLSWLSHPSTDRTATMRDCRNTMVSFPTPWSATNQTSTHQYNYQQPILCVTSLYIHQYRCETHPLVESNMVWYSLVVIITQFNTQITMYVHNLTTAFLFGMCRVYWFAYYFTDYQHLILS